MLVRVQRLHELNSVQKAKNDEATALDGEAHALWQQGQRSEAIAALTKAKSLSAEIWGEVSYPVANLLDLLARWQIAAGDQAAAETFARQALEVREKVFTRDHPDTVANASALGLVLQAGGRNAEAEPLLRDAA